jgi:hypothetical protein
VQGLSISALDRVNFSKAITLPNELLRPRQVQQTLGHVSSTPGQLSMSLRFFGASYPPDLSSDLKDHAYLHALLFCFSSGQALASSQQSACAEPSTSLLPALT